MSAKQKLQDFSLRLKSERKIQVIVALCVIAVLFLIFSEPAPKQQRRVQSPSLPIGTGALASQEAHKDIMLRIDAELEGLKEQSRRQAEDTREIKRSLRDYEERTAGIFDKILQRMREGEARTSTMSYPDPVDLAYDGLDDSVMATDALESFGLEPAEVAPPPPPARSRLAMVGAGDSVRVKLIAGVNAPTDGTPYPVVLELASDIHGPDGSALPLGNARLIAAAQGSLSDNRALFRLTSLNIRLPDGSREIVDVDGWIVGEDGIRGMEGLLVDPIAPILGSAVVTGGLDGIGRGFSQSQTTTRFDSSGGAREFITGDPLLFGLGRGVSGGAQELSHIIRERIRLLVPHIKVLSGREATAVFSRSFTIHGLYEALEDEYYGFDYLD